MYKKSFVKFVIGVFLGFLICQIFSTTLKNEWKTLFTYPEAQYKILEEEANRMILNKDFSINYEYEISSYNKISNKLVMKLKENYISVICDVENYGESNERIILTRSIESEDYFVFLKIFDYFVLLPISKTIVFLVIISLFLGIKFVFDCIKKSNK